MGRGVLTEDVLGQEDGPHASTAEAWLTGTVCETCWTHPAWDDHTCLACALELTATNLLTLA